MPRYIDADALLERMRLTYCKDCNNYNEIMCRSCLMDDALTTLEDCPTADVAPRAEVAIDVLDEAIRAVCSKIDLKIYNTIEGKPLGDGVAFGKQQAMYDVIALLAALKKKYTERCPDCKHFVGCECFSGQTCDQYEEGASETVQEQAADTDDVVLCKDCFYNKNGSCMMSEKLDKDNYDPNYSCGRGYRE